MTPELRSSAQYKTPPPTLAERWRAWDRWWRRPAPPHLMAVFRIAFGGFLLFYFALQIPHVQMLYSRDTLLLPAIEPTTPLTLLFTPPPVWVAQLLFGAFLTSLLLFTIGALTRVSAAVAFLLYVYYWILSLHQFGTSFDRLFLLTMLILVFSGCGRAFSVDIWVRYRSFWDWRPISVLPQRLIAAQLTATYLGVGWQKLTLETWQTGEVLSYGFIGRWATAPAWYIARLNLPLWFYDIQLFIVKSFEILMPFGLWIKKFRWWFFLAGFIFHTSITILLGIWWFQVLIPAYIVFFEPEEVYEWLKKRSGGKIP